MKNQKWSMLFLAVVLMGGYSVMANSQEVDPKSASARSAQIRSFFDQLNIDTLDSVYDFYQKDVHFIDPLGEHHGADEMKKYYGHMYRNVTEIRFEYKDEIIQGDTHVLVWDMHLKADGLNDGQKTVSHGSSIMKFNPETNKVAYHRDYFDLHEFVYQYVPIVKSLTKMVNKRLASAD